jgi:hypothetical protein
MLNNITLIYKTTSTHCEPAPKEINVLLTSMKQYLLPLYFHLIDVWLHIVG